MSIFNSLFGSKPKPAEAPVQKSNIAEARILKQIEEHQATIDGHDKRIALLTVKVQKYKEEARGLMSSPHTKQRK